MRSNAFRFANAVAIFFSALGLASCANLVEVKVGIVDQRTALENQVLGSYEEIGGDVLLLASVRSIDPNGHLVPAPHIPEGKKKALRAMQRSQFNQDDIERFKTSGALGEGKDGYLTFFETEEIASDPNLKEFVLNLMEEENEDRRVLYERITETNENFKKGDLPRVEAIMAGLNRDTAKEGERIQLDSGEWVLKGKRR